MMIYKTPGLNIAKKSMNLKLNLINEVQQCAHEVIASLKK